MEKTNYISDHVTPKLVKEFEGYADIESMEIENEPMLRLYISRIASNKRLDAIKEELTHKMAQDIAMFGDVNQYYAVKANEEGGLDWYGFSVVDTDNTDLEEETPWSVTLRFDREFYDLTK